MFRSSSAAYLLSVVIFLLLSSSRNSHSAVCWLYSTIPMSAHVVCFLFVPPWPFPRFPHPGLRMVMVRIFSSLLVFVIHVLRLLVLLVCLLLFPLLRLSSALPMCGFVIVYVVLVLRGGLSLCFWLLFCRCCCSYGMFFLRMVVLAPSSCLAYPFRPSFSQLLFQAVWLVLLVVFLLLLFFCPSWLLLMFFGSPFLLAGCGLFLWWKCLASVVVFILVAVARFASVSVVFAASVAFG